MKHENWQSKRSREEQYRREITRLFNFKLGESDNPYRIVNILNNLANESVFQDYCNSIAYKMVTMIEQQNMRSWREAASKGTRGNEIYKILMRQISPDNPNGIYGTISKMIAYNATLIKNIPIGIAENFTEYIEQETLKGRRGTDISKDLEEKFPAFSQSRIKLIARTEVSKTQSALTESRALNLGLDWYIWRTSKDARVRHSHHEMDRVLVRWSDPPNPEILFGGYNSGNSYHAGNVYNCRCYSEPVISVNMIDWSGRRKVHVSGSIVTMSKTQFLEIS